MRCDDVISITLLTGEGDEELKASAAAVERKYENKKVNLVNKIISVQTLKKDAKNELGTQVLTSLKEKRAKGKTQESTKEKVDEITDETIDQEPEQEPEPEIQVASEPKTEVEVEEEAATPARLSKPGGIGLYWACHGNEDDTDPPAKQLAEWTALLYELGLKFTKINLNACKSAGTKNVAKAPIKTFCETLEKQLGDGAQAALEGLAVAGYTTNVEFVDREHSYYKGKPNTDFSNFGDGVHNATVVYGPKTVYTRVFPAWLGPKVKLSDLLVDDKPISTKKQVVDPIGKLKQPLSDYLANSNKKTLTGLQGVCNGYSANCKRFQQVATYVTNKNVWIFALDEKQNKYSWMKGSITNFTDNMAICDTVQFVELALSFAKCVPGAIKNHDPYKTNAAMLDALIKRFDSSSTASSTTAVTTPRAVAAQASSTTVITNASNTTPDSTNT